MKLPRNHQVCSIAPFLSLALSFALLGTSANAAVINTQVSSVTTGNLNSDYAIDFDVQNTSSLLVVGLYIDSPTPTISGVRFGDGTGIGLGDIAPIASYNDLRTFVYVFANPSTAIGLKFRIDDQAVGAGLGGAIFELANADLDPSSFTLSTASSITTDTVDEFIVCFGGRNGTGSASPSGSSDIDLPIDVLPVQVAGGGTLAGGSTQAPTVGVYDVSWSGVRDGSLTLAFEAVPEPSSTALLGLGGLALMLRRRK
ncbi:MAG: hypothetical protein ACJAR1_001133 [Rubritalea sp.]|jgi:hypothetical protein